MSKRCKLLIKVISAGVSLCAVVAFSLSFIVPDAVAISDSDLQKKVLYNALGTCINSYMQSPIDGTKTFSITNVVKDSPKSIVMPTYASNGADLKIDCKQLFVGTTTIRKKPSKYTVTGLLNNLTPTATDLGYVESGTSTSKKCISVKYNSQAAGSAHSETLTTNAVCFPVDGNTIKVQNASEVTVEGSCPDEAGKMCLGYDTIGITWIAPGSIAYSGYLAYPNNGTTIDELKDYINKNIIEPGTSPMIPSGAIVTITGYDVTNSSSSVSTEYKLDSSSSALKALRYVAGPNEDYKTVALTDNDYYQLYKSYMNYVTDAYRGQVSINKSNCSTDKNVVAYVWTEDGTNWCEVTGVDSVTESFGGRGSGGWAKGLTVMDFRGVLSSAKSLNLGKVDSGSFGTISGQPGSGDDTPGGGSDEPGGGNEESGLAVCYEGTGVLGWIACPVIELVGNATSYLYEHFIEPSLQIKAVSIMSPSGPVHTAWEQFRGFANILFAVAFAVIILAQLTGIGISNYNIKKMLPRLIVVAVLVNISFILCQIAVDLSNILGVALKDLFLDMAEGVGLGGASRGNLAGGIAGSIVAALLAVGATATTVTIVGASVVAATLSSWIVPILVALLGCVVAVIFFFILLGVRQAGVVILVVLTPLAIVCYALPNTKSFFDKWKKMFTGLLLLYPICGAMMGAGEYAGALLLQVAGEGDQGMFYALVAMLINVVPFFFIPTLLKQSMLAMGNLGVKISNLGNNLGRGLTSNIQRSRAFQEHQGEAQRRLNLKRDETRVDRLGTAGSGKSLIAKARRGLGMNSNLSRAQSMRMAIAQSNIDKSTDTGAQMIRARWDSDGTSNNFGDIDHLDGDDTSLVSRYISATRRLFRDPTDHDALEEQKAAAAVLASNKFGRNQLRRANNLLGAEIAGMSDETQQRTAKQIMQRTATNLRRTNSGDIAKSPLLDEQVTGMQDIARTDYGKLDQESLISSIGKLKAKTMSGLSKQDLEAYVDALNTPGLLDEDQRDKLISAASETLNDPRYKNDIERDARKPMHQIANSRYSRKFNSTATPEERQKAQDKSIMAMAGAGEVELNRVRSRIQSDDTSEAERNDLLNTVGQTLVRAANPSSGVKLSASQANQMLQTLNDNKYDLDGLARQGGMADAAQLQERLDVATGIKIQRAPRTQTLRERHANWQRATATQATSSGGKFNQGDWINTTTGRRLNQRDAMEADMLEARDVEAQRHDVQEKIDRDDAAYIRSRTPIPVPPSPSGTPDTSAPTPTPAPAPTPTPVRRRRSEPLPSDTPAPIPPVPSDDRSIPPTPSGDGTPTPSGHPIPPDDTPGDTSAPSGS